MKMVVGELMIMMVVAMVMTSLLLLITFTKRTTIAMMNVLWRR
jgi:hypothetical protein